MRDIKQIRVSEIRVNENDTLRSVDKETENFKELATSVANDGVLQAITVSHETDEETGIEYYLLLDGAHRLEAAKDAQLESINATIDTSGHQDRYRLQMIANMHRVETKPTEFARQILRILEGNPMLTVSELASQISRSTDYVNKLMGLTKIEDEEVRTLIDSKRISLANALQLAKLAKHGGEDEMKGWVDDAVNDEFAVFGPKTSERIKELREEARKGRDAASATFSPVAALRKLSELKDDSAVSSAATRLAAGAEEAFVLGVQWVMQLDPSSVEHQENEFNKRKEKAEAKKAQAKADREAKKVQAQEAKLEKAKKEEENARAQAAGEPLPHPELEAEKQKALAEAEA